MKSTEIVIVSGYSGTGKTCVLKYFEALGFYCVDNLPIKLIDSFLELYFENKTSKAKEKIAVGVDIRSTINFNNCRSTVDHLRSKGFNVKILFLTSKKEVLLRRYQETRSVHPLTKLKSLDSKDVSLEKAVDEEFKLLEELRKISDIILDTSSTNVHQLKSLIFSVFSNDKGKKNKLIVRIISFGFSKGIPVDSNLIFDVRFLPNPFFESDLKDKTGQNEKVAKFIESQEEFKPFWEKFYNFISFLIPQYENEGKTYLTISVGCTGGKHRSVAIAEKLADVLKKEKHQVILEHRDMIL
jgi:RNase adapter protein RapZ